MAVRRAAASPQRRPGDVELRRLSSRTLERMAAAGREVEECTAVLAKTGDTVVGEILRGQPFFEWDHYPAGEVYDGETGSLFYYHAHPPDERGPQEHGHFHTFLKPADLPAEIRPLPAPGKARAEAQAAGLAHLIAISMDGQSRPCRLFATNRWVTGESWHRAKDVVALIDQFSIGHARPSWPANRWVTAMLRLFRPQIAWLLEERDRRIAAFARSHPGTDATEVRGLEIVASLSISVEDQRRAVEAALAEALRPGLRERT